MTITREQLAAMYPRALPDWLDALAELGPVLAKHYRFNRLDWVHFCGQIAAETNGLALPEMRENMNFRTASRILAVYRYRLGVALQREPELARKFGTREALAKHLVGKPKELADLVYGGREGTPWRQGWKYIGRGPTQITHLNSYRAVSDEIARQPGGAGIDLVANPELLATDPELGIRSAFADWAIKGLSRWAQADDCDTLSDALNTGNIRDNVKPHGLPRRRLETKRAKAVWPRPLDFSGASLDLPPVPAKLPPDADIPSDLKTVVKYSRKARIAFYAKRFAELFTIGSIMDFLGFTKGLLDDIKLVVLDHGQALAVCAGVLAVLGLGYVLRLSQEDVAEGRSIPSGLAKLADGEAPAQA